MSCCVFVCSESTTKSKLASLNEKLDLLERRLEMLEVQVSTATANPSLFATWSQCLNLWPNQKEEEASFRFWMCIRRIILSFCHRCSKLLIWIQTHELCIFVYPSVDVTCKIVWVLNRFIMSRRVLLHFDLCGTTDHWSFSWSRICLPIDVASENIRALSKAKKLYIDQLGCKRYTTHCLCCC